MVDMLYYYYIHAPELSVNYSEILGIVSRTMLWYWY
jgi:hypothetical protein